MKRTSRNLLILDGFANLALGAFLLAFPFGVAPALGIPTSSNNFYPAILGGVLFGVGIALMIEAYGRDRGLRGLGLEGAIAINFCGASALAAWLAFFPLNIPARGYVLLWAIAVVVFLFAIAELAHKMRSR